MEEREYHYDYEFNANTMTDKDALGVIEDYIRNTYNINSYLYRSFVIWKCKTIQNVKFIIGTNFNNNIYELTFNGDKNELYIDVYEKIDKVIFKLD